VLAAGTAGHHRPIEFLPLAAGASGSLLTIGLVMYSLRRRRSTSDRAAG